MNTRVPMELDCLMAAGLEVEDGELYTLYVAPNETVVYVILCAVLVTPCECGGTPSDDQMMADQAAEAAPRQHVTRDMAIDAGDVSVEGWPL